ncbi:hypothetical protein [Phytohabitans rumicis]|uniref:HNH endonuclease n=1 Tax=Phytohabitans rumicis TaxID=1076125 RepID=A0A6V8L2Q8_9ACTN|nr:hypothetical protein [Phytohabitans rumicis]GFJ91573.1 hypothetical protein Prum_052150 [Phytohabitans rumicis]
MSRSWAGGSTRAWRKLRQQILMQAGYQCQIRIAGVCTGRATCVHHTQGRRATGDDPAHLQAACQPCNARINDPAVVSKHQTIVTWVRAHGRPVAWREIVRQFPDHGAIGKVLIRAVQRGELARRGRGLYAAGPTALPPTIDPTWREDPPNEAVTRW